MARSSAERLIPRPGRSPPMVDVDSVLLSLQERDKWRRRMEVLERSLGEIRDRRHRLEVRLRRIKKELARVRVTFEAVHDMGRSALPKEVNGVPRSAPLR